MVARSLPATAPLKIMMVLLPMMALVQGRSLLKVKEVSNPTTVQAMVLSKSKTAFLETEYFSGSMAVMMEH
jgi:hypothetical protein